MITLKHVPNIFKSEERTEIQVPFDRTKTIRQYLEENHLPVEGQRFIVTNKLSAELSTLLDNDDEVIVTPRISDPVSAAIAVFNAVGAWVAANTVQAVLLAVTIGYSIYQATQKPKLPSFNLASGSFEDSSPTYGWDGIRTLQGDVNTPIGIGYGRHRLGGAVINQFVRKDGEKEYLHLLLAMGEGLIDEIDSVQINDNPVENFESVEIFKRYGANDQEPISHFNELHQSNEINAQITKEVPYIFTTVDEVDAFEVFLSFPLGIYFADPQGGIQSASVVYKVEYREVGTSEWFSEAPESSFVDHGTLYQRDGGGGSQGAEVDGFLAGLLLGTPADKHYVPQYKVVSNFQLYAQDGTPINSGYTFDYGQQRVVFTSWLNQQTALASGPNLKASYNSIAQLIVSDKTRTRVTSVFRKERLTRARYDIRVSRVSDDSTFENVSDMYIDQVDEITTDDLAYPNTALLGIRALATEQLSGSVPNITAECRLRRVRVPDIKQAGVFVPWEDYYWDPDTEQYKLFSDNTVLDWDGVSYVNAWSANPVWCFRDLLTNTRYGLGEFIDVSDLTESHYLEMSRYCEEKVEVTDEQGDPYFEKRFRMDVVIDGLSGALDLLVQLAAVFRGMPFYSNGKIKLYIDKPETPVQLFGMGNVIRGSFRQRWSSKREKYNVVECSFLNKNRNYRQETVAVADEPSLAANEPRRVKQLRLLTTYPSIALRESRYALSLSRRIDQATSFKVGVDGIMCHAGEVIQFSHDVPLYGFSGRIQAGCTTTSIVLDREVTIESGKSYALQVRFNNDVVEQKNVSNAPGTYSTLTVSSAFSDVPQPYDVFAFGEVTKVSKPYRVLQIRRESNQEVEIQGLEYDPLVYDDTAMNLPSTNFSALGVGIPLVANLLVTERLVKLGDGTIEIALDVWWKKPALNDRYLKQYARAAVYLSDNGGGTWNLRGITTDSSATLVGGLQENKSYRIAVVSIEEFGSQNSIGTSPYYDITTVGKTAPPSNVTGFAINLNEDHIAFEWNNVSDIDLSGYEIRQIPYADAPWELGTVVDTNIRGTRYNLFSFTITTLYYAIKAIDTSRNYSANAAYAQILITDILGQNIVLQHDFSLAGGTVSGTAERIVSKDYDPSYYRHAIAINTEVKWDQDTQPDGTWDIPVVLTQGQYITDDVDLGAEFASKVGLVLGIKNTGGGIVTVEIAYGASANPTNWTAFQATSTYAGRYFRFRITFQTTDPFKPIIIYRVRGAFDVPDKIQEDSGVSISATGETTITLDGFTNVSTLLVTPIGAPYISEVNISGLPGSFTVKLFDIGGVQQAGTVNYYVKGF